MIKKLLKILIIIYCFVFSVSVGIIIWEYIFEQFPPEKDKKIISTAPYCLPDSDTLSGTAGHATDCYHPHQPVETIKEYTAIIIDEHEVQLISETDTVTILLENSTVLFGDGVIYIKNKKR